MLSEKEKLKRFLEYRCQLIDDLNEEKISRDDFNYKNILFIKSLELRPFSIIKNYEQGIFNYQYFNVLAKEALTNAEMSRRNKIIKKEKYFLNLKDNYYSKKDQATLALVKLSKFNDIEAYYINTNSNSLNGKLFEIHFKNKEKCILHSKNKIIKDLLIKNNIFKDEYRNSLIDQYVNNK